MGKDKKKRQLDGGFGARLTFAIFMTLGFVAFFICFILFLIAHISGETGDIKFAMILFGILSAVFAVYTVIGYICAYKGVKSKSANVALIVFGAPMCASLLGVLAVAGAAVGIKDINDPQRIEQRRLKKEQSDGFGMRLSFAIILTVLALIWLPLPIDLGLKLIFASVSLIASALQYVSAFVGKNKKAANVLSIVLGILFVWVYGLGALAIVGGIRGRKKFIKTEKQTKTAAVAEMESLHEQSELVKGDSVEEARNRVLTDYPIDYENKPAVSRLLDFDNRENLFLENEDGTSYEFHQLYVTVYKQNIYALTQTVGLDEDELVVFRIDYENDLFHIERDEYICDSILNEYRQAVKAMQEEEEETVEYIQPKTSPKAKKGITIAATVSYGLLLLMGILLASVPAMSGLFSGMGICAAVSERAYGITIGVMWVTLSTAAGWLFVSISPWNAGKKGKIIIAAVSTALLVAMNVVFFIVINAVKLEISIDALDKIRDAKELERWLALAEKGEALPVKDFFEGEDKWFIPVSTVFASLAIIVCHALSFFRINPNKIKARKPQKSGEGIFVLLKYFLRLVGYGLLCFAKVVLTFKEKLPEVFVFVAIILLTWLAHFVSFVVAILCIALAIGVVVMYFAGVISLGLPDTASGGTEYYFTNDMGCRQTVYSKDGKKFYNSNGSYVGSSEDGKFIKVD